jgi:hypothetical protein
MNTNIHEQEQRGAKRMDLKIKKKIRGYSCSFVTEILFYEIYGTRARRHFCSFPMNKSDSCSNGVLKLSR